MTPPRALRQLVLFLLLALPLIARAGPFAGLDRDGDFSCSPDDMGPTHTWGEVGTVDSFQVYFADIPDLYAYSCFFCVQETASINFHSWTYHHPPGWTEVPIKNSEDHGLVITPWVSSAYPNVKCWQVEATDFTFSSPMSFPAAIGTFRYEVADDGPCGWLIDGEQSAYLQTDFANGFFFGSSGSVCPPSILPPLTWATDRVDSTGEVGNYPSVALDSQGRPHISYFDETNSALKYAYWTGSAWSVEQVDNSGYVGNSTALCLDDSDLPHIAYRDGGNDQLRYATNSGGGWVTETVDTSSAMGYGVSLALDPDGFPHITHSGNFMKGGRAWPWPAHHVFKTVGGWTVEPLTGSEDIMEETSVAVADNGEVHVSFSNYDVGGDYHLMYGFRTTGGVWQVQTVDSDPDVGARNAIAVDGSGKPHIAYLDEQNYDLRYAYKPGTSWEITVVDTAGETGHEPSIAIDSNGDPRIAYYDGAYPGLKYAACSSGMWSFQYPDEPGVIAVDVSIVLGGYDDPHIAYYDISGGTRDLKYAHGDAPPVCSINPSSLDFGSVRVFTTEELSFTISNRGGGTLAGDVGYATGDYMVLSGGGSFSLGPGEERVVTVQFEPLVEGVRTGTIDTGTPLCETVSLSGAGAPRPTFWLVPDDAPTIAAGLDSAISGDTIEVQCGTYHEHGVNLKSGVLLRSETGDPGCVTIDADSLGVVISATEIGSNTRIEGFTLTGGNGVNGGAIYLSDSSPTIHNCVITGNHCQYDGAGVYCREFSAPAITNCVFSYNDAGDDGGAMMCRDGSAAHVTDCLFVRNESHDAGGALYCYNASPDFGRCTFSDNTSLSGNGGAMSVRSGSTLFLDRTILAFSSGGEAVQCAGGSATFTCSDIFGNAGGDWTGCIAGQDAVNNNLSVNPIFCDRENDEYGVNMVSPLYDDPSCGRIGYPSGSCDYSPEYSIVPPSFNLGTVRIGEYVDYSFTITNIDLGALEGDPSEACAAHTILSGGEPFFLGPGESREVEVRFEPATDGDHFCSIDIDGQTYCSHVSVEASGAYPECEVDPQVVDFGPIPFSETRDTSIVIRNVGLVSLGGFLWESCGEFSFNGLGGFTLAPGDSHVVDVTFDPSSQGLHFCTLNIDSDNSACSSVDLSGIAAEPACSVSPPTIDFGDVEIGDHKDTTFIIDNDGMVPLAGTVVPLSDRITILSGETYDIGVGEGHTVTLRWAPGNSGTWSGSVETGDDACTDIACTGNGYVPDCLVGPSSVDFGTLAVGDSVDTTVVVANLAAGVIQGIVGGPCSMYSHSSELSTFPVYSLFEGDSFTIHIRFRPTEAGAWPCTIELGCAICSDIACSGAGADPSCAVSPEALDFGEVPVGETKDSSFTIENDGAISFPVEVGLSCGPSSPFSIAGGGGGALLAPGETRTVTIRFSPTSADTFSCGVETGADSCGDVACTGTGVPPPACSIEPDTVFFGAVALGGSTSASFTIENAGGQILSGEFADGCGPFTLTTADRTFDLAAGVSKIFEARFVPAQAGTTSCALPTIDTNADCSGPFLVGVAVTEPVCSVTPASIDFGTITTGEEAETTFVIQNSGSGVLTGAVDGACGPFLVEAALLTYALGPGDEVVFPVRFAPESAGTYSCSLDVGTACALLALTGSADDPPLCEVAPDTIDFGTTGVNAQADSSFTITNRGGGLLAGSIPETCGFFTCGIDTFTLGSGESATVPVRFLPTTPGVWTCGLSIGGGECSSLHLAGNSPALCEVRPDTILFGAVPVGISVETTFTLGNAGGALLEGELAPGCGQAFFIPGERSYSLAPGEETLFTLRFAPPEGDLYRCDIDLGTACGVLAAIGTGEEGPLCRVFPTEIRFPAIAPGERKDTTFTITNDGGGILAGTTGEGCGPFHILGTDRSYSLTEGETAAYSLRYAPTGPEAARCTLAVGTACPGIALLGTGEMCAFDLIDPEGGDEWPAGGEQTIRWTSAGEPGEVRLELLRGGVVCDLIAPRTADDGEYVWQVIPCGGPGDGFQVRVSGADDTPCADTSDGTFAILAAPVLTLHQDSVAYDHDPLGPVESPPPPPPRPIIVENTGWGELSVWARPAVPWITVDPESAIVATGAAETLDVYVIPDLLCCGNHVGTIGLWTARDGPPAGEIHVGLRVTEYSPGDCNGDHAVDLVDVALMIDHILEITPLRPNVVRLGMADLNGDGATNVADIVRLAHAVAGKEIGGLGGAFREGGGAGTLRIEKGEREGEHRLLLEGLPSPRAALLRFQGGGGGEIGATPLTPSGGVILERRENRFVLLYYDLDAGPGRWATPAKEGASQGAFPLALLTGLPAGPDVLFLGGEAALSAGDVRLLSGGAFAWEEADITEDRLHPAYPNPFTRETWVAYHLSTPSHVRLAVFTVAGRQVRTLHSGGRGAGSHQALWDGQDDSGRNVAPGIYFLRLETSRHVLTRRVTVLR